MWPAQIHLELHNSLYYPTKSKAQQDYLSL
jgi:hypothetical protein